MSVCGCVGLREGACVGGFLCVFVCARGHVTERERERESEVERQRKCERVRCVCG